MLNKLAVESCKHRDVGDEEDVAESPGMFDWFFNLCFFLRLPQYNQVLTFQGTKRNFPHTTGWRCSLSVTAPGLPVASVCTAELSDNSTGPLRPEAHVTVGTQTHGTLDCCSAFHVLQYAHTGRQS